MKRVKKTPGLKKPKRGAASPSPIISSVSSHNSPCSVVDAAASSSCSSMAHNVSLLTLCAATPPPAAHPHGSIAGSSRFSCLARGPLPRSQVTRNSPSTPAVHVCPLVSASHPTRTPRGSLLDWDAQRASPRTARDGGGARTQRCPRCVVGVPHRRVGGKPPLERVCAVPPPRAALRPAALSCAPCDTVHPHPAKHRPTASRALHHWRCVLLSHRLHPVTARRPQRCNVNDVRRCWCSSDAQHTRGYAGTLGPNCLER
jgi:hypothetical protein